MMLVSRVDIARKQTQPRGILLPCESKKTSFGLLLPGTTISISTFQRPHLSSIGHSYHLPLLHKFRRTEVEVSHKLREREKLGSVKRQDLMEFLDCRGCSQPLSPPVFQCSLGHPHFLCSSCSGKLLSESKCKTCSGAEFRRCPAMEDAVNTILLPCKHACGENVAYYGKDEHEKVCKNGPCFCPEPGCGFTGPTAVLFDHFTTHHKWPATILSYGARFDLPARPGTHILRADDGHIFLLNVGSLDSGDLRVSLVSVQANTERPVFTCSFTYEWRSHHTQNVWLDKVTNSSLSDGLPEGCSSCLLPSVQGEVTPLLKGIFIMKKVDDEDEMEWEEDDDDSSFEEHEEEDEADDRND